MMYSRNNFREYYQKKKVVRFRHTEDIDQLESSIKERSSERMASKRSGSGHSDKEIRKFGLFS